MQQASTHISIRVPDHLADALGEEAKRSGRNRSEIVREALERRLDFGGRQVEENGHRDGPDISDAMSQLKSKPPERVRRTGQMTTSTGPPVSGLAERRRKALMRAKLLKNR